MTELYLFGGICLDEEERWDPHPLLSRPKCMAVLAYLAAARPQGCHRRDKLLALFWPDSDERRARGALRKTLFQIRQEAGEDVLNGCGCEDVGVNFDHLWCDVVAFHQAMEAGDLETALSLCGGEFMDGFHLGEWPFDQWVEEERRAHRLMAARAGWTLALEHEEEGRQMDAAHHARQAADFAPFDEVAHQRLLLTLDRLGDRAGALREHQAFARRLETELQLSPSPETLDLVEEIRARGGEAPGVEQGRGNGNGSCSCGGSVAVLPFASLTQDPESQTFADLLHEDVISRLQVGGDLHVPPRAEVLAYQAFPQDLEAVANEMEVETLLEGSVRSWNGHVRISLDLVGGPDRGSLWRHTVERTMEDDPTLRAQVAEEVARRVRLSLQTP